ncbi:MAG: hypothetical protein WCP31_08655, partial [Chloroflexales bacterium]
MSEEPKDPTEPVSAVAQPVPAEVVATDAPATDGASVAAAPTSEPVSADAAPAAPGESVLEQIKEKAEEVVHALGEGVQH